MIRELTPNDRDALQTILTAAAVFTPAEIEIALEVFADGVAGSLDGPCPHFGLIENNALVGYICVGQTPLTDSTWHLYWIAVHPAHQNKGHARYLLTHAENFIRSRNAHLLVIETSGRPDYAPARRFYQSNGYHQVGQIPNFYRPNDDCVLFCKPLP